MSCACKMPAVLLQMVRRLFILLFVLFFIDVASCSCVPQLFCYGNYADRCCCRGAYLFCFYFFPSFCLSRSDYLLLLTMMPLGRQILTTCLCICLSPLSALQQAQSPSSVIAAHCVEFTRLFVPQLVALHDESWLVPVNAILGVYDTSGKRVRFVLFWSLSHSLTVAQGAGESASAVCSSSQRACAAVAVACSAAAAADCTTAHALSYISTLG